MTFCGSGFSLELTMYMGKKLKDREMILKLEHCPVNWEILANKILCEKLIET